MHIKCTIPARQPAYLCRYYCIYRFFPRQGINLQTICVSYQSTATVELRKEELSWK